MKPTRRRFVIGGCGTGLLPFVSGCFSIGGSGTAPLILHNEATNQTSVAVTVVNADDNSSLIDASVELDPNTKRRFGQQMRMNEQYRVTIAVQSGPNETHEWDDVNGPLHVIVDDSENVVFATEVG